jgi:nucleoside diphosphate kinase
LIRDYIRHNLSPDADGRRHRAILLVFKGKKVLAELAQVAGHLSISSATGETIRDTFGDLVLNPDGSVRYFEPAVLLGETAADVRADLQLWVEFARTQPVVLTNVCSYACPEKVQQTLVIIKPDSWRQMSSRPGAIIDMFSRTGLRIIGLKICQMSVAQALEFYGPVKDVLCRKLAPGVGNKAREILQEALNCQLPVEIEADLAEKVGVPVAIGQFERIIEFMSGVRPSACPPAEVDKPGRVKCMALVYEGEDAVQKIRDVLGPTDPNKAPSGTVRREFGHDVMVNTAHASDSPENAKREMDILRFPESDFVPVLEELLREQA